MTGLCHANEKTSKPDTATVVNSETNETPIKIQVPEKTSPIDPEPVDKKYSDIIENTIPVTPSSDESSLKEEALSETTETIPEENQNDNIIDSDTLLIEQQTEKQKAEQAETKIEKAHKKNVMMEQERHDTVTVKGQILKGRLISFNINSISFETIYGTGPIEIPYTDLEDLSSLAPFYFQTTSESFFGRVVSYRDGLFVIQNLDGNLTLVSPKYVQHGILKSHYDENTFTQLRYNFPFWNGNLGLSLENDVTTIDKLKIRFSLTLEKRLKPSRYRFDSYVNYDEDNTNVEGIVTKDERFANFIYEHDTPSIHDQSYAFLMPAYESDQIRKLNSRWFPSIGLGYRFLNNDASLIQFQTGLALVNIDYVNADDQNFHALHLGMEANHTLKLGGINFHGSAYYMPSMDRKSKNHLTRVEASVLIPLIEFVRAEVKYILLTDNSPEPDVGNNKKNFYIGVNIDFLN